MVLKRKNKPLITPDHFRLLIEQVYKLAELPPNWNQYGALAIEEYSIIRGIRLLYSLKENKALAYWKDPPSYNSPSKVEQKSILEMIELYGKTEDGWTFVNQLTPSIDYYTLTISPTPIGGIEFSFACHLALVSVIVPPENNRPIHYEEGWVDEGDSPTEYRQSEKGKTYDYDKIARVVRESIYQCL